MSWAFGTVTLPARELARSPAKRGQSRAFLACLGALPRCPELGRAVVPLPSASGQVIVSISIFGLAPTLHGSLGGAAPQFGNLPAALPSGTFFPLQLRPLAEASLTSSIPLF